MLHFSLSSVLMTLLFCNLSLIFLAIIFSNRSVMLRIGFPLLKFFCVLIIFRLCFPFELPVTTNIYWPEFISKPLLFLRHPWFEYTFFNNISLKFSIWTILQLIWLCGILFFLCQYCYAKYSLYRFLFRYGTDVTLTEPYCVLLSDFSCKEKLRKKLHIYTITGLSSPMICKFVHYYILLPEDMTISKTDLSFILSHEISHALHHDLTIKFLVQILCIIYWWNPACILLKNQLNLLLESRVDVDILSGEPEEKINYLECLLKVSEECTKDNVFPYEHGIAFFTQENSLLIQRFELMTKSDDITSKKYTALLLLPIFLLYLFSLFYTLEATYISPEIEDSYICLSPDNTYLIRNDDGTYNVYFQGTFFEKTDSLKYYKYNYKIYNSPAEAEKKQ